jgi:hydrogenase nickel incorporation protein HypA/HybF
MCCRSRDRRKVDVHELSIALSLVDAACDKARPLGNIRVDAVCVRIGPLSGVVKDALEFCFEDAARGTAIEGARLDIEDAPLVAFCASCGEIQQLVSIQHLRFAVCGAPVEEIVGGRELDLIALEVSDCAANR